MFKDEAGGKQIIEFVGLRAKLYSFKMLKANEVEEEKKCKGIKKAVVEKKYNIRRLRVIFISSYKTDENNECLMKSYM